MSRRQIDSTSAQWNAVDFQLQLITGKSSIKLINLFKLSDDPIHEQIFKTDAIINATDFSKEYIEKVRTKTIPLQDLMIFCGHVNIHTQSISNKIFTFLIGKVALGRRGTAKDDVTKLDSILIDNDNERNSFQYNFFLRSHEQYHLRFQAYFTVGEEREFNPSEYRCASCQNKQAFLYCRTQKLYFCQSCSLDHHRSKILQGHQLQKVDKINTLPLCKSHNQRYSVYCLRCEKYLCMLCMQKGGSHGNSDHPVYPIQQIYQQKRQINEILAGKQKQKLENLLRSVQLKRQEIVDNYGQVKRYIQKQKEKAVLTLDQLMLQKSMLITSDELQLRMLNEKLDWAKAFIKFQQKTLKPIHYFHSQHRFQRDLQKAKIGQFQSIYNVKGDLAVQGEIVVARKQVLDRAKNKILKISGVQQKPRQSRVSTNLKEKLSNSLYVYNAGAQVPQRGELYSLLQNSQLNFFTLSK